MKKISKLTVLLAFAMGISSVANAEISYQHIRNATAKVQYGDKTFLVDPYLATKGEYEGFAGTANSQLRNPLIDMSMSAKEVLKGVDAVVVTHTHDDHWDKAAQNAIPKDMPIFVQNADDAKIIRAQGFKDVRVVGTNTAFGNVKLQRIKGGQHGTDEMYSNAQLAEVLGDAMGVVFQTAGEKTLYIVGDTIWNKSVDNTIEDYKPEVIVLNTGYAMMEGMQGSLIMGTEDVATAHQKAPNANLVTVHMDAVNHATISSQEMRNFIKGKDFEKKVSVPKEGETLKF